MKKSAGRDAQDLCATTTELVAAMESLSAEELRRLKKGAQYRIRGLGRAAEHRGYGDLLGEAYTSTLKGAEGGAEGRKWAKNRVSLVKHLLEAMRSIANHWKVSWQNSGAECVQPDWLAATEDEDGNERRPTEWAVDMRADTHRSCSAKQQLEELDKHFATDDDARLVIEARIEGMTVPEMITGLKLTEKKVNAAHQRIRYVMEVKGWTSA